MKSKALLLLICLFSLELYSEQLAELDSDISSDLSCAVYIQDLYTDDVLYSFNAKQPLVPASVVKLLTIGAALELLGPNHRFKTELAYSGSIEQGCLKGNLYILGAGDPTLGSEHLTSRPDDFLQQWLDAIRSLELTSIEGDVIAVASIFNQEAVSPYWLWEDLGNYYAAGVFGLAVFDNMFRLGLRSGPSGSRPEILYIKPELNSLEIFNRLSAKNNTKDSAFFYGMPYCWQRYLYGSIPAERSVFEIRGDIPDPPVYLADRLFDFLQRAGIRIKGKARALPDNTKHNSTDCLDEIKPTAGEDFVVFCHTESKPLSDIIKVILHKSNNLYTEYLLRHIALADNYPEPVSAQNGLDALNNFWAQRNVNQEAWQLYDASGLSPLNRLDAESLALMLRYMALNSAQRDFFLKSLPIAGKEGTVINFGRNLPGTLRLKSGSMNAVMAYAGYWELSGKTYCLVLLCNQYNASREQIRKDIEQLLLNIYNTRMK